MRPSLVFLLVSLSFVNASWFGGSDPPQYTSWSKSDLHQWLSDHNINAPSTYSTSQLQSLVKSNWLSVQSSADSGVHWSADQYSNAQKAFQNLKDSSFDAWDESRLREFLLEQGVVAPSGPRDQLVLLAKQKYRGYIAAGSTLSDEASKTADHHLSSASSLGATASTAVAHATKDAMRKMDDGKDYIYSTWDEGKLRKFLEDKGLVDKKVSKKMTRKQLLEKMRSGYASVTEPIWDTWSDSYMREWLVTHGLIPDSYDAKRATLNQQMKHYYYSLSDKVWSSWSDSELKSWLVKHGYVKSNQQINREKMIQLFEDNYASAISTFWDAWSDSDIRNWLIEHGYLRTNAQIKRDELVKAINDKYTDVSTRTAAYLIWPDARLRAYLRQRGVGERALPTSRPGLLQETRIRWIQTTTRAEQLYAKIRDLVNSSVTSAEDILHQILEMLTGHVDYSRDYAQEKYGQGKASAAKWKEYGDEKFVGVRAASADKKKKGAERLKGEL